MTTHYETLGVSPNATSEEIKHAFREKAKKYHPDVSELPDAHEQFVKIGEAYNILKDPKTRKQYDKYLAGSRFSSSQQSHQTYDAFKEAQRRARAEAENYAVISLEELKQQVLGMVLDTGKAFFVGSDQSPELTFFDYLKMGFVGFLLTFSLALSFSGLFTLPGIIVTVLIVSNLFKKRRFVGIFPFILSTMVFNLAVVSLIIILILSLR